MIKTNYAIYNNLEKKYISLFEHTIKWKFAGLSYDNVVGVIEYALNEFPEIKFLIIPVIDEGFKKIYISPL
jgi:hypothetical protein